MIERGKARMVKARNEKERCKWPDKHCIYRIAKGNRFFCPHHFKNGEFLKTEFIKGDPKSWRKTMGELAGKSEKCIDNVRKLLMASPTTRIYNQQTLGKQLFQKIIGDMGYE